MFIYAIEVKYKLIEWQKPKYFVSHIAQERIKYLSMYIIFYRLSSNFKLAFKSFYNMRNRRKVQLISNMNKVSKLIQLVGLINIRKVIVLFSFINSRIKRMIKNIIILRAKICIYDIVIDSVETRESHSATETREIVQVNNNRLGLHVGTAIQRDYGSYNANYAKLAISARSETNARTPARKITPLAESVAAGASRRLARRPMVGRRVERRV